MYSLAAAYMMTDLHYNTISDHKSLGVPGMWSPNLELMSQTKFYIMLNCTLYDLEWYAWSVNSIYCM